MLALITAALSGLAAIPKILDFLQSLNLGARLNSIEKKQQQMNSAFLQLSSAKSPEEYKSALDGIAKSWS